jgi:biotin carboxyl carrier protein
MKYVTTINGREYMVELLDDRHVKVDGVDYQVDFSQVGGQPVYSLLVNGVSVDAHIYQDENTWQVTFRGQMYSAQVEDEREKRLRAAMGGALSELDEFHLKAPMPGMVVAVPVQAGQQIQKGDVLVILESMKMQNELKSPRAGTVARLRVNIGDRVEKKDTLLSVT